MKKVMISQPMRNKDTNEILTNWHKIARKVVDYGKRLDEEYVVLDTLVQNHIFKTPLECFAESVKFLSEVDILCMAGDWANSRGCILEYNIASEYDVPIIYEEDL